MNRQTAIAYQNMAAVAVIGGIVKAQLENPEVQVLTCICGSSIVGEAVRNWREQHDTPHTERIAQMNREQDRLDKMAFAEIERHESNVGVE